VNVVVSEPNGTVCTRQTFPIATHNGPVTLTETFYVPDNCPFSGDTISSTFTAPGVDIPLPTETIP
jgi:hypothetical protein